MKRRIPLIVISGAVIVSAAIVLFIMLSESPTIQVWSNGLLSGFIGAEKKEVRYESLDGTKSINLSKVNINGVDTIIDSIEGPMSQAVVSSEDGQKCALYSDTGIQSINIDDFSLTPLLNQEELDRFKNAEKPKKLIWQNADSPKFSYDNSKLLFATIQNNEYSIWVYDFGTKKTAEILRGEKNEYLNLVGWLDNNRFIFRSTSYNNNHVTYYICDVGGHTQEIDIPGKDVSVLGIFEGGYITYIPDYALSDTVIVAKEVEGSLQPKIQSQVSGIYRDEAVFCKSAGKIVIPYKLKDTPLEQLFTVCDPETGSIQNVKVPVNTSVSEKMIFQADGNDLLIYSLSEDAVKDTPCWKYNLQEGAK